MGGNTIVAPWFLSPFLKNFKLFCSIRLASQYLLGHCSHFEMVCFKYSWTSIEYWLIAGAESWHFSLIKKGRDLQGFSNIFWGWFEFRHSKFDPDGSGFRTKKLTRILYKATQFTHTVHTISVLLSIYLFNMYANIKYYEILFHRSCKMVMAKTRRTIIVFHNEILQFSWLLWESSCYY